MKKFAIAAGALVVSLACLAGCAGGGISEGVRMEYSTGRQSERVYDRDLFYSNTN